MSDQTDQQVQSTPSPKRSDIRKEDLDALLSNNDTFALLSSAIAHQVTEVVESQRSRSLSRTLTVLALGVTIAGSLGFLADALLEKAVAEKFSEFRKAEFTPIYFARDLGSLITSFDRIDPTNDQVNSQINRITRILEDLNKAYLKSSSVGEQSAISFAQQVEAREIIVGKIERLYDRFARESPPGALVHLIFEFEKLPSSITDLVSLTNLEIYIASQAIGREYLGVKAGAQAWSSGDFVEYENVFPTYLSTMERAQEHGFPELRLLHETVRIHMEDPDDPRLPGILDELAALNELDETNFVDLFSDFLTEEWRAMPDEFSGRVRDRAVAFLNDYASQSPTLQAAIAEARDTHSASPASIRASDPCPASLRTAPGAAPGIATAPDLA